MRSIYEVKCGMLQLVNSDIYRRLAKMTVDRGCFKHWNAHIAIHHFLFSQRSII